MRAGLKDQICSRASNFRMAIPGSTLRFGLAGAGEAARTLATPLHARVDIPLACLACSRSRPLLAQSVAARSGQVRPASTADLRPLPPLRDAPKVQSRRGRAEPPDMHSAAIMRNTPVMPTSCGGHPIAPHKFGWYICTSRTTCCFRIRS
jgi:hypothetical protein